MPKKLRTGSMEGLISLEISTRASSSDSRSRRTKGHANEPTPQRAIVSLETAMQTVTTWVKKSYAGLTVPKTKHRLTACEGKRWGVTAGCRGSRNRRQEIKTGLVFYNSLASSRHVASASGGAAPRASTSLGGSSPRHCAKSRGVPDPQQAQRRQRPEPAARPETSGSFASAMGTSGILAPSDTQGTSGIRWVSKSQAEAPSLAMVAKLRPLAVVEPKLEEHAVLKEASGAFGWPPRSALASFLSSWCRASRSLSRSLRLRGSLGKPRVEPVHTKGFVAGGGAELVRAEGLAAGGAGPAPARARLRRAPRCSCCPRRRASAPARSRASKSSSGMAVWQSK